MGKLDDWRQELRGAFDAEPALREHGPLVFSEGPGNGPALMLVGEAPGAQEALQGRPFVGKAGKNLDEFLAAVGLERQEIYISNVVKIRPTKISAAGGIVNRPPSTQEKSFFIPWLYREVRLVSPGIVVTLGNVALQAFGGDSIGGVHGVPQRMVLPDGEPLTVFPLYHPASVIYNRSLKAVYEQDLQALAQYLKQMG